MRSGLDTAGIDPAIRAEDDLFGHCNGKWWAESVIPDDRAVDGAFYTLRDRSEADVRAIIDESAASGAAPGTVAQKVGDLYRSFMDVDRLNALGAQPLKPDLTRVTALTSTDQIPALLGELQRRGTGGLFYPFVDTDSHAPDSYALLLEQGGLGLPDEAYYRDSQHSDVLADYAPAIAAMLTLAGVSDPDATAAAAVALETRLAAGHWDVVACRDAVATWNSVERAELDTLAPGVDWAGWFGALAPSLNVERVIVRQPSFLTAAAAALRQEPLSSWQALLTWQIVRSAAPLLHEELSAASFAFYGLRLTGAPQQRERWKRGVSVVESSLGEAVGELYVERHFPATAKAAMLTLVGNLVAAYRYDIERLTWMGAETRARALDKLEAFTPKIGYPDRWRSYESLTIDPTDLIGNIACAAELETARAIGKLGGPVDRLEWFMTPQTVNAYYNPGMNEIVFPAAILQPPFFDIDADDAVNYGGIGAVIGHEIGHGFDDQGARYDGTGALVDWWTPTDKKNFEALSSALIKQFDAWESRDLPGHHVNGALTVGENIGDLGGAAVALQAYRLALGGSPAPVIDGFTGEQRFFLGWAAVWRSKVRAAEAQRRLAIDPHSPPDLRCNIVRNLAEFHEAFGVTAQDDMWLEPSERVRIW